MVVIVGASRDKPMPPCLTANSARGGAGGGGKQTNKQTKSSSQIVQSCMLSSV